MAYYLRKSRKIVYRRKYRGRYGRKSTMKSVARRSYNQLLYNPFAKTNMAPKIADGREYMSSGIRLQGVTELKCDGEPFYVAVFPGLSNGIWASHTGVAAATVPSLNAAPYIIPYKNHYVGNVTKDPDIDVYTLTQDLNQTIAKWRLVSQGIRFQLLNNSDENEGWFEMIRYQMYPAKTQLSVTKMGDGPVSGVMALSGAAANTMPGYKIDANENLCEHPTYQTGKLRHLNRMIFKLFANTGDHEFISLPGTYTCSNDFEKLIDTSFDCLLFKIHPRSVDSTVPASQPTKLLCHVISNQEIVYDESSTLARHMTSNGNTSGASKRIVRDGY